MSALLHFGKCSICGTLWLNTFNPPCKYQVSYVFLSSCISSLSSIQVSNWVCHRSIQTSYSVVTLLDWGSLASQSSQLVGRHSLFTSYCKKSHHGSFSRLGAQGSAITELNPLATQKCVLCRQGFSSSTSQAVTGASTTKVTNNAGKNMPVGMLNRVYQAMPFLPLN